MKVLYNSNQVRHEIIRLMSASKRRRVAIVAYVGEGANTYLPNPNGLHLVCWPCPGGTNPYTLRLLIKRGVKVSFVDSLHMKLYWTEGVGAVITSANLSSNALGAGDLKEVGVLLSSNEVKIDKILTSLKLRTPSKSELDKLDRLHDSYQVRNRRRGQNNNSISFTTWYDSFAPRKWRLGWFDATIPFSRKAIEISKRDYGIKPNDFMSCKRNDYTKEDWVLCFRLGKKTINRIAWMFVDYIVRVPKEEKSVYEKKYPFHAVQVASPRRYPPPPFKIDGSFRRALNQSILEFGGANKIMDLQTTVPPKRLLNIIRKHCA